MLDISTKAFQTSSDSLAKFFQRQGVGYYIPLYQRPYSWDSENIDQLMEDICSGVNALANGDEDAIHFIGTAIFFQESNPRLNIKPLDHRALPERIDNVIDGQQRISTLAILATLLYERLTGLKKQIQANDDLKGVDDEIVLRLKKLEQFFCVDLGRGFPNKKPIIIRGSIDQWTFDGNTDNYKSDLANYIAEFISSIEESRAFPKSRSKTLVSGNIRKINSWLNKVKTAHEPNNNSDSYPSALKIIESVKQEYIWSYDRPEMKAILLTPDSQGEKKFKLLSTLVQYLCFTHFLTERCCLTLIQPFSENWAFDMFQSLNATGTPLTAIETFKPLVVNHFNKYGSYKDSDDEKEFVKVDKFLDSATTRQKNRLTNEYLTALRLVSDGIPLSTQFSSQRAWLNKSFVDANNKSEFIRIMANLAEYWENVLNFKPHKELTIAGLERCSEEEKRLVGICTLYLRDAGHKMANTVLSRFYSMVLRGKEGSDREFVAASKSVAAFFTLWRAAYRNTGLDDVYRKLMKGDSGGGVAALSWSGDAKNLTVKNLKNYFNSVLANKNLSNKEQWKKRAIQNLRYDTGKHVCKFSLYVAAHDTNSDEKYPGLMSIGTPGQISYLDPNQWVSAEFKTIEHIAPLKRDDDDNWDSNLYEDESVQLVGNLTLLPTSINTSASNKSWNAKMIYFRHLAETNPENLSALQSEAAHNNINLAPSTIDLLKNTSFKHHLVPIISNYDTLVWDSEFVKKRTERICDILWERIIPWLT